MGKRTGQGPHDVGEVPSRATGSFLDVRPICHHPSMSSDEFASAHKKSGTGSTPGGQSGSDRLPQLCAPARIHLSIELYRQMYAARHPTTARAAKVEEVGTMTAHQLQKLFRATPMPELAGPYGQKSCCPQSANGLRQRSRQFNLRPVCGDADN